MVNLIVFIGTISTKIQMTTITFYIVQDWMDNYSRSTVSK